MFFSITAESIGGLRRSYSANLAPWPLEQAVLLDPLRSVQFKKVELDSKQTNKNYERELKEPHPHHGASHRGAAFRCSL